jgi:hypothetical protein
MKKKIITLSIVLFSTILGLQCIAQNELGKTDDYGRIVLNTYVSDQIENLPASAEGMLANKLSQIVTTHGLGGTAIFPRFIITPNIIVVTKDITATAPPMVALNLEITFYIGDGIDGTKFATTSVYAKGVGKTEAKAYISAIKQIKPGNPAFGKFIEKGKNKIIEYYNSRCDFIIKEAESLASQDRYGEAIYLLSSVPEITKECFDKAMDAVGPIYQKLIDRECLMKLAEARNAWNAGLDRSAADAAAFYLSGIEPRAACFDEAAAFSNEIGKRVYELDQREWNFRMKVQQDNVDLRRATIEAARAVGVAYGNNQPDIQYNIRTWW